MKGVVCIKLLNDKTNIIINAKCNIAYKLINGIKNYEFILFNFPSKYRQNHPRLRNNSSKELREALSCVKELLTDDGAIAVCSDFNNLENVCELMNEIFDEKNFISTFLFRKNSRCPKNKTKDMEKYEYLILYGKSDKCKFSNMYNKSNDFVLLTDYYINDIEMAKKIGYETVFNTNAVKKILSLFTGKHSRVLACFTGTGTVGQAVFELNYEDNGERVFTLLTDDDENICNKVCFQKISEQAMIFHKELDYIVIG